MRKPKLSRTACVHAVSMLKGKLYKLIALSIPAWLSIIFIFNIPDKLTAQCLLDPGQLRAAAFLDQGADGHRDGQDASLANAFFQVFDPSGDLVTEAWTDASGEVIIDGLENGQMYRVEWELPTYLQIGPYSDENGTLIQFVQVPGCSEIAAVDPAAYCDVENPDIAVTCFVKGGPGENDPMETIVSLEYFFKTNSPMQKLSSKGETGAVWGLAWKASTRELFSSSFIKQYAHLGNGGPGGIYRTSWTEQGIETSLFADLAALNYPAGALLEADHEDCGYGAQVGYQGLGGMALSGDESTIFVVNVDRNSVIALPSANPNFAQMREFAIPDPGCSGGAFKVFALKYYQGSLYVGGTCNAADSKAEQDLSIHIFKLDPETGQIDQIFTTNYPKGYWYDYPADGEEVTHWLTDIEFTRQGNMVISLSDRSAHRYCGNGQILNQFPDILMVWKDDQGLWHLENNGTAGPLTGTGQNNGQGPGGGEFFGEDHWVIYPEYHSEVAMGTVFQLPNSDEIVLTAFDPLYNTFAGGLHRYNTLNGKKTGAIELYQTTNDPTFGKASGLGEMVAMCGPAPLEIGNFIWLDLNKNGVQDPGESPVAGLELALYDAACQEIGRTNTNAWGQYFFNSSNVDSDLDGQPDGLHYNEVYYLTVTDSRFDEGFGFLDYEGEFYSLTSRGIGTGQRPEQIDSDARLDPAPVCPQMEALPSIRIETGGSGQNDHSFDIGFQPSDGPPNNEFFDLALRLTTDKVTPVKPDEQVIFHIELFNQGVGTATSVCLVDYLPAGLEFDPVLNPAWERNGNILAFEWTGNLVPGDSTIVPLILIVKSGATASGLINAAEICGAKDEWGRSMSDVDSYPDNDPVNDIGGEANGLTDNMIDDHGDMDEDDHDPETLILADLALVKKVVHTTPVKMGEEVLYSLELINQGNVTVKDVEITDLLPKGMMISPNDLAGWVQDGQQASLTIKSSLPAGEKITVFILVVVTSDMDINILWNRAEITAFTNTEGEDWSDGDFDSTPGNGMMDEDDMDEALLPVFDLALRKTLVNEKTYADGEKVLFRIEVFNQGNLDAIGFTLADHLPAGLFLSDDDKNGWISVQGGMVQLTVSETISVGSSAIYEILTEVAPGTPDGALVNISEIISATPEGNWDPVDFDSYADMDPFNDAGGEAGAVTDDLITDHGGLDEDDHDPAIVIISNVAPPVVDLSVRKRTMNRQLNVGDLVEFELMVLNEGEVVVGQIELTDYFPSQTILEDPAWGLVNLPVHGEAARILLSTGNGALKPEGLLPGDSVKVHIHLRIKDDTEAGRYINFVEISHFEDLDGVDLGGLEIDSNPDDDPNNDVQDLPGGPIAGNPDELGNYDSEDDFDYDEFVINSISRSIACECLDNETTPDNGQFLDELEVYAVSGQQWFIELAEGFFRENSPSPPAIPVPFDLGPNGDLLTEYPDTAGMSYYRLRGIHVDGQGYKVILRNEYDERLIMQNVRCYYDKTAISGLDKVCRGSVSEFEVIDPLPRARYNWSLSGGGMFVNGNQGSKVSIQWQNQDGGPYTLRVSQARGEGCFAPGEMVINIGQEAQAVSCKANVQISINQECIIDVTPEMLLAGGPYDLNSYAIMLTDKAGDPIPNLRLGREYLDQDIMAKVINVCTGNSCWSRIVLEDKIAPQIECLNDTMRCNNLSEYTGPLVWDNCDPDPTVVLLNERIEPLSCDENFVKRVIRSYQAYDASGNESEICEQVILLRRINLNGVEFPEDRSIATMDPLVCGAFPMDKNGNPDPEYTGVPYLEGIPIYPYPDFYCNAAVYYTDTEIPGNGCVRKIMRVWNVMEWWCSRAPRQSAIQILEITDNVAPVIVCPRDMTVTVQGRVCEASVSLPEAQVSDNCTLPVTVDIIHSNGFLQGQNGGSITLPVGLQEVVYRATDPCYNSSECTMLVEVVDKTPPVAVCDQHTVVGLSISGEAEVFAATFDDGSYDGCWIDSMAVRRMAADSTCGLLQNEFAPSVLFCCADAGQSVMVEFRVWDEYGNANSCMVEVTVQDKIAPVITDLPDQTIDCYYIPTEDELAQMFGFPQVTDNCEYEFITTTYYDIDQCREGTIVRMFSATDANNTSIATQTIHVVNQDPFTRDDITWPLDTTVYEGCNSGELHPDELGPFHGYPVLNEDECDLTAYTWEDETFEFVINNDACFKIVRHWKVVNWCRDDAYGNPVTFEYDQTIKVHNTVAPTILTSCDSVSTCTYDDMCLAGFIELVQEAEDDCTPGEQLNWEYQIDTLNDGTFDIVRRGNGSIADASGEYPIGLHRIKWSFEDKCGNKTSCTQFFEIINCKAPIVYCKNGIIVELMPMDLDGDGVLDNELVEIWAKDLDNGSSHPCGYPLTWSFGRDTTIKNRVYDCDSIGRRVVEICVTTPNGNQACCITEVIVQDNNDVDICDDIDCVIPPPDTLITDCRFFNNPTPDRINSRPDTSNCPRGFNLTITYRDRGFPPVPPLCGRIERTWTVELDLGGRIVTREYVQNITFQIEFEEADIVWPVPLIELDDCVGNIDPDALNSRPRLLGNFCGLVRITFTDLDISDPNDVCRTVRRTWTVTNLCDPAQVYTFIQTIIVYNDDAPIVTCPADVTVQSVPNACGANVNLDPAFTTDCSTGVTFSNTFNAGGANASGFYPVGTTVVTFTATDRCGQSSNCQTSITVLDTIPPVIICPADQTVSCEFMYRNLSDFGEPVIIDNCMVTVTRDSIFNLDDCQIGTITRTWVVTDLSGNTDSCAQTITFENPNPFTMANITWPMDTVEVNNCGAGLHPDTIGSRPLLDTASATCELVTVSWVDVDVSDPMDVCQVLERTWTVENECTPLGLFNFTQVIILYNAQPPLISCPMDVTVSADPDTCGAIVTLASASTTDCSTGVTITNDYNNGGPDASGFYPAGTTIVTFTAVDDCGQMSTCQVTVTVIEDVAPEITCPANMTVDCEFEWTTLSDFGEPVIVENCMFTLQADSIIDLNICQLGMITRNWVVTDFSGNSDSCMQIIVFENPVPFNELDHITWPMDTINIDTCAASTHPDTIMSRPMIDTLASTCDLVTVTWADQSTSFCNSSPCLQIERTWTITDSCQYDPSVSPPAGQWTFLQIINVNDFDPPVISGVGDTTVVTDSTNCDRFIELIATVMDCDPNATIRHNSPFAMNMNSGDASGEYPYGVTFVTFYAEDACCNEDSLTIRIEIIDSIAPTAMCMKSVKQMPDTLSVPFFPWDMVGVLFDNCTDSADITLSYDPIDPNDTVRVITCDSLDMFGEYLAAINIYITDEAGNQDTCQGFINVVDPDSLCPRMVTGGLVAGSLRTESGEMLAAAQVHLEGSPFQADQTGATGRYAFPRMPFGGSYIVRPVKDINPMNGVTTKDLVRIQRHILGDEPLTSPYQIIAADIDRSNSVSAKDLVWLRKMILGYQANFPNNNTSWRFVDEAYVFPDPSDPFAPGFPEIYDLDPFMSSMAVNFIGVKIGDVTGNASVNNLHRTESRTSNAGLVLEMEDQVVSSGETQVIRLYGRDLVSFSGFQTTITWDPEVIHVESVQAIHPEFNSSNFGTAWMERGMLMISWDGQVSAQDESALFQLVVRGDRTIPVHNAFAITDEPLYSESYDQELNTGSVTLEFKKVLDKEYQAILYQNQPNPFSDETHIVFSLPERAEVRLTIFDLSGKRVWEKYGEFEAGVHAVPLTSGELQGGGMYIYRLESNDFTSSKRMYLAK